MSAFARWEDPRHGHDDVPSVIPRKATREGRLLDALGPVGDLRITIDFECFWEQGFTLRGNKTTTESYVRDPRFEVIGVGVKVNDQPSVWLEEWDFRERAKRVDWDRVTLIAHHAQFDGFILSHHYGIKPRFIVCTMSIARALHGGAGASLEYIGPKYGLGKKGDDLKSTKGKRRVDMTQAFWLQFGAYCRNDVDLTAGFFNLVKDKFPPLELWLIDTTIRMFTEPVFRADQTVLEQARSAELEKRRNLLLEIAASAGVQNAPDPEEAARTVLASSDKFAAVLRSIGIEPPVKQGKRGETFAFAKNDPGMQALIDHERDDVRALAETRLAVKSTITVTRAERIMGIAKRGAVPFYLKYAGAHTHRWAGGDKMNPQNFNRGGDLRDAIVTEDGEEMAVCDSAQIEARTLPWVAGETRLLETFRRNDKTGGDFYSDEGSRFFLKPISKRETPLERQVAKNMCLGLGYGMGWEKFAGELLKGMLGSPPVQFTLKEAAAFRVDVDGFATCSRGNVSCADIVEKMRRGGVRLAYRELLIHCAVADHFVRLYRATNQRITAYWRSCENVLRVMERDDGDPDEVRMTFGCLKVVRHGLVKPNGLKLIYPGLHRSSGGFAYIGGKSGRERKKIYGGLLCENIVQSIARDIVGEQLLWVRAKYATPERRNPIATTTHDEMVGVVKRGQGADVLAFMKRAMGSPPSWCSDLPLSATGDVAVRYGDAK